jgi:hypothetical protein
MNLFGKKTKMDTISNNIEFKYKGGEHSIDLNTLLATQMNYVALINTIKNQYYPDAKLSINVQGFEKGSFEIHQIFEMTVASGVILFGNINYVKEVFDIFKFYVDIKKFLGGKKPDLVDKLGNGMINLVNNGNNNMTILNVSEKAYELYQTSYNSHRVLQKIAEALDRDDNIEGIEVINQTTNEIITGVDREQFPILRTENPNFDDNVEETIVENAMLNIVKLEIAPSKNSKWDFIYDGRKINSVLIADDDFLNEVADGLQFSNGDILRVDLKITSRLDTTCMAYVNEKYTITKVTEIIHRPKQQSLF